MGLLIDSALGTPKKSTGSMGLGQLGLGSEVIFRRKWRYLFSAQFPTCDLPITWIRCLDGPHNWRHGASYRTWFTLFQPSDEFIGGLRKIFVNEVSVNTHHLHNVGYNEAIKIDDSTSILERGTGKVVLELPGSAKEIYWTPFEEWTLSDMSIVGVRSDTDTISIEIIFGGVKYKTTGYA